MDKELFSFHLDKEKLPITDFCILYYEKESLQQLIYKGVKKTENLQIVDIFYEVMKYFYPLREESLIWKLLKWTDRLNAHK